MKDTLSKARILISWYIFFAIVSIVFGVYMLSQKEIAPGIVVFAGGIAQIYIYFRLIVPQSRTQSPCNKEKP